MGSRVTDILGIQYPVVQAPLVWLTDATLVAAVSNAGGLGTLGPNAGLHEPQGDPAAIRDLLCAEARKVRALTDKPFACNYITGFPSTAGPISLFTIAMREAILAERIPVVAICSMTPASEHLDEIRAFQHAGTKVIWRDLSPTVAKARAAEAAGVDIYVATGHESGGSLSANHISTLVIVSQITDALSIPVLATGGIISTKNAAAARAIGAEGVYAGTRFVVAAECRAAAAAKRAIIDVCSEDLICIGSDTTGWTRILPPLEGTGEISEGLSAYKIGMLDGDLVHGLVAASESAGGIHEIKSAAQIVQELGTPFANAV